MELERDPLVWSADRTGAPRLSGERSAPSTAPVPSLQQLFGVAGDGAVVHLRCSDRTVIDLLGSVWPPMGLQPQVDRPCRESGLVIELSGDPAGPDVRIDGATMEWGWDAVESALGLFAAEHLADLVAVHAAVMVWDGAAVIVPGPSYAGKSTLAVAAAAAGAIVASDEYALIDPKTGLVRGWNRRVRLRTPSGLERVDVAVDVEPVPVAVVASIVYGSDVYGSDDHVRDDSRLRPLARAETAFALLENTVCATSRPRDAVAAAALLARTAHGVGGTRGEAAEAVDMLRELCRSRRLDTRHG